MKPVQQISHEPAKVKKVKISFAEYNTANSKFVLHNDKKN